MENGRLNGLSEPSFHMLHGNLTDRISGKYQIVTANIVADAIIMLTPSVIPFLDDNAVYIVSGIIDTREDEVQACLIENGFEIAERKTESGWVCLICRRA